MDALLNPNAIAAGAAAVDTPFTPAMERLAGAEAPMLVVRFPDAALANARLGGLSLIGRWTARALQAGRPIAVIAPGGAGWPEATADDFTRIGASPTRIADAPAGAVVLEGRFLPGVPALEAAAAGRRVELGDAIDLAEPRQALRRILLATAKPTDGVVSRWLNRPISQRISAWILRHLPAMRPSHVTGVVAAVAMAMVLSLLFGGAGGLIAGGVLFHVASVLDGVDGELARAACRGSPQGAALDTRVDMLTNVGYFVCIAVALTRLYGGMQAVVGGLAVLLALVGLAIVAWLARRMGLHGSLDVLKPYYRARFPGGWQFWVTELLVMTTSRDFFAFAFGVVIVIGLGWAVSWLLLGFILAWLTAVICAVPGVLRQAELRPLTGI